MAHPSPLPTDSDALRGLVEKLEQELEARTKAMDKLRFERDAALKWTDLLSREIDALKRSLFGKKSERFCPDQLSLDLLPAAVAGGQVAADGQDDGKAKPSDAAGDAKAAEAGVRGKKGSGARPPHGRRDLFAEKADRQIFCTLENPCCAVCRGALCTIGNAVSRRIDWVPGHHEIVEISLRSASVLIIRPRAWSPLQRLPSPCPKRSVATACWRGCWSISSQTTSRFIDRPGGSDGMGSI